MRVIFLSDYFQPEFYRFNEDSIVLAKFVVSYYQGTENLSLLDVGAGCGIIGIEVAQNLKLSNVTLLEPQEEFIPFIEKNISQFLSQTNVEIVNTDIEELHDASRWDIITMNPPYFCRDDFRVSQNILREKCRSFDRGSLHSMFKNSFSKLSAEGSGFIVFRNEKAGLEELNLFLKEMNFSSKEFKVHEKYSIFVITNLNK